jgi:hypothetical protein
MILLQFLLLKAQHFYETNPRNRPLTSFEKFIIGTSFWTIFILGSYVTGLATRLVKMIVVSGDRENRETFAKSNWNTWGIGPMIYKILATWLIHQAINFFLETVCPFWEEMSSDAEGACLRIEARARELLEGVREFAQGRGFGHKRLIVLKHGSGQEISLERHQVHDPLEGQRTLDWNIVVDKNALDEMKETLGPPGGFGEMGFNVSKDGVSFEAMGVGTRFNLKFSLKVPPVRGTKLEMKPSGD